MTGLSEEKRMEICVPIMETLLRSAETGEEVLILTARLAVSLIATISVGMDDDRDHVTSVLLKHFEHTRKIGKQRTFARQANN